MDMEILSDIIKTLCCPECRNQRLKLKENFSNKQGLATCLVVVCACGYTHAHHTSCSCGKKEFDINRQIVYTMRSCGLGYSGIEQFTLRELIFARINFREFRTISRKVLPRKI